MADEENITRKVVYEKIESGSGKQSFPILIVVGVIVVALVVFIIMQLR